MRRQRLLRAFSASALLALGITAGTQQRIAGQVAPGGSATIQSLTEPGQGLAITSTSPHTGLVTFAASPGAGMLLPHSAADPAVDRALSFVALYGTAFGLTSRDQVQLLREPETDVLGAEHVRFQQMHFGVPVRAGEFLVHLKGARVTAANGHVLNDLPADVTPAVAPVSAQATVRSLIEKNLPAQAPDARYSEPRLEIFNQGLLEDGKYPTRLAWFVEATGPALRQYVWIDAKTGDLILGFSQLTHAKNRTIYNANSLAVLPGTLVRSEGGAATGDTDADLAYTYAGLTYDYFFTMHGRDSFDNAGGEIRSSVHYCPAPASCPYANAFWNGTQMVYGNGFASADDVVAHELTHAVTEHTANLLYYNQSGALNESFSDIHGETVDLTDGAGTDTPAVRWLLGEDVAGGAIRNMMDPTAFGDPGKMSDAQFYCNRRAWTDVNGDSGGVHTNSGVPNHAFALMVDGGTYNGQTITGIGTTKAAKIEYWAETMYLTSGSGFLDARNALNQSCTDLIGAFGITADNCAQVAKALVAVEMGNTVPCAGAAATPPLCPTGSPVSTFSDGFESGFGAWTTTTSPGSQLWLWTTGSAHAGVYSAWGTDINTVSLQTLAMTSAVTIPAGGRLYFDNLFEFENGSLANQNYDGGVLEYSTDGGTMWIDAGSLMDAGQLYNGTIINGFSNPLVGRSAFTRSSWGYTGTRLDLSSLAGLSTKFRFRVGTDTSVSSLGWLVDGVTIYTCVPPPTVTLNPSAVTAWSGTPISFTSTATGAPTVQWQFSTNGGANWTNITVGPFTNTTWNWRAYPQIADYQFRALFTNAGGSTPSAAATLTVRAPGDLNGDLSPDVVWSHRYTGQITLWLMDNAAATSYVTNLLFTTLDATFAALGDFNGDFKTDLVVRVNTTGQTEIILMNGTGVSGSVSLGVTDVNWDPVAAIDFDGDRKHDLLWRNRSTGQNLVWFMDGTTLTGSAFLSAVPDPNWRIVGVADFNGDAKADILWRNIATGTNRVWYMDGVTFSGHADLDPVTDMNWSIAMVGDFNRDSYPDLLWRNYFTGQDIIWYLDGTGFIGSALVDTVPDTAWEVLRGRNKPATRTPPSDFNRDWRADILWRNTATGQNLIWNLSVGGVLGYSPVDPVADPNWKSVATADFNNDGKPDIFWRNMSTGQNIIWFMNGALYSSFVFVDPVPVAWRLQAVADFDNNGKPDLVWRNTSTGQNRVWYMNGAVFVGFASLDPVGDQNWQMAGAADFNNDGKPDLVWRNATLGQARLWYMNGVTYAGFSNFDTAAAAWNLVQVADFNNDGKPDLLWRNGSTGQNLIWHLHGTITSSYRFLETVANLNWKIGPHQ